MSPALRNALIALASTAALALAAGLGAFATSLQAEPVVCPPCPVAPVLAPVVVVPAPTPVASPAVDVVAPGPVPGAAP